MKFARSNSEAVSAYPSSMSKRLIDIFGAILLLILIILILPVVFVTNCVLDRGSLFYISERIGRDGKVFRLVKFRTMRTGNKHLQPMKQIKTLIKGGAFLRKAHIDEFPQAINVILGDMSLVGPRPFVVSESRAMENLIPGSANRYKVKPGITGLAQIAYEHSNVSRKVLKSKFRWDLKYISSASLTFDIYILSRTFYDVMRGKGE